jgi:predicted kinase
MTTFYMFHGLPGSGKSTLAEALVKKLLAEGQDAQRVNRDDLRTLVAGDAYHSGTPQGWVETKVTAIQEEFITELLSKGVAVVSDDTNLKPAVVKNLRRLATAAGVAVVHIFVDVPVAVAQERNAKRGATGGRLVPPFVINKMAEHAYNAEGTALLRTPLMAPGETEQVA